VQDAYFRHFHKDEENSSVETSPREHIGFLAQIYGGFVYAKPNGNVTFGKFFRNVDDKNETPFTILNSYIEVDSLNVSSQEMCFLPVKATVNSGYGYCWFSKNKDSHKLYTDMVLEDNPYLDGFYAEGTAEKFNTLVDTLYRILRTNTIELDKVNIIVPDSTSTTLNVSTVIRPFSLKCHVEHRFSLGDQVLIPTFEDSTAFTTSTLTKIVWTFRGGYELGCTGGDTRMLSDSYRNSQARKVQRLLERKINYYR
jgi:hypothetical protein